MSRPSCPTCDVPIDPAHAPVARIRGTKIVTFCSVECAEGKPAARQRSAPSTLDREWGDAASVPALAAEPAKLKVAKAAAAKVAPPAPPTEVKLPVAVAASEPTPLGASEPMPRERMSRRRKVIAACAAVVFVGLGLAVIDGVVSARGSSADVDAKAAEPISRPHPAAAKTEESSPSIMPVPAQLFQRAITALTDLRASPSRRIERLATMALTRTGDKDAIAGLQKLLETEESSLIRIALAYALARAGEPAGREVLVAGLAADRRDVRTDAAIALLNLGDDQGRDTLSRMTSISQYQISACGHLARAGDSKAKVALEKIYNDPNEDAETVLRSAVALGRAGDQSVADFLRGTLADGRFQVGAALALAELGDKSAIEPLTRQLELNAMRVPAALSLRRLEADVALDSLAVALTEDDEVTRLTAAEAILILSGPKELAARE